MHQALSTSNVLALALCGEEPGHVTSFGDGLEISLARAGDQVTAPEWVQVLPLGPQIVARDGRRFTLTDPQALLANLRAKTADLPMDIEHATEIRAPKGEDAPAQGWAKDYELRDDGIWARVDWTPSGARRVADKEYRYVSPAIRHTPTGEIVSLSSFALTTQPALVMPALAHAQRPSDKKDPAQMSLHTRLAAALGLAATATEDELITAATGQVSLAREARDPAKYVPAADLTTALARAKTAEDQLAARDAADATKAAEATVDAAIAAGKIAPASRDHWVSLCRESAEATGKIIAELPALLTPPVADKKVDGAGDKDADGLTPQQVALCRDNGWDPASFADTLKETAAHGA
jgi:phage I-like protein